MHARPHPWSSASRLQLLCVGEDAYSRLRLLQLFVDGDERLQTARLVRVELHLLVVQSFRVGVTLLSERTCKTGVG